MDIDCNLHVASFSKSQARPKRLNTKLEEVSGDYVFKYTYPLRREATFKHSLQSPTGAEILLLARADYEAIYKKEEEDDCDPGHVPGMLNRAQSNGPYGIWGHDITDLYFETIHIDTVNKTISFVIGS